MREYGQVQSSFWGNPDIVGLSDHAKLLACYLMTGPHSNGLGCYRLPDGYVMADLQWSTETLSEGFAELFKIGFAYRCETTFFVLIPNFLRWNPVANGNVATARQKEFETIPKNAQIFSMLCKCMLKHSNRWVNSFETVLERYAKQEPTLPNPTRTNQKTTQHLETVSELFAEDENEGDDKSGPTDSPPRDRVPVQQVVDLYHEILPELPKVQKVTDTRRGYIQQRWREDLPDIKHWRNFFNHIRQSDFLMGRTNGRSDQPPFRADLEWLTKAGNFAKIAEDKYHGRRPTS